MGHFRVKLVEENPDVLFFSLFGTDHLQYENCFRVLESGENKCLDKYKFDISISFLPRSESNFYRPLFGFSVNAQSMISGKYSEMMISRRESPVIPPKNRFCNFVYQNSHAKERIEFCEEMSKYFGRVDCPGKVPNNMHAGSIEPCFGNWIDGKLNFIKDYRFTIAFENEANPDYITEKIFHPLLVGSIPIYWGAQDISNYFSPECFINVKDFNSYKDLFQHIEEIESNETLYEKYRTAHPFEGKNWRSWGDLSAASSWLANHIQVYLNTVNRTV